MVRCGPTADALVECEGLGFDGVLDVLGGSPDSAVMTVVVERIVQEVRPIPAPPPPPPTLCLASHTAHSCKRERIERLGFGTGRVVLLNDGRSPRYGP